MNKRELVKAAANAAKENGLRKYVSTPKKVFFVSDEDGNTKQFVAQGSDSAVLYNAKDVEAIFEMLLYSIKEALKNGEDVSIRGFGRFSLRYHKPRMVKDVKTDEKYDVGGRYYPHFYASDDLKMVAKLYQMSLEEQHIYDPLPVYGAEDGEELD